MDTHPAFNSYYEKLLATGEIKCIDKEIPFEIPDSWSWCRLSSVFNIWSARRVHEKDWRSKGIPFYRAREIGKLADYGVVENDLFIDRELYDGFSKSGVPQIGDLMMTAVGTLGKTYIVDTNVPFYYKDGSVLCIGNPHGVYPKYLKAFFESTIFSAQYLSESDGTTVATLTMIRMNKYLIPLPPLKEQIRIMDKASSLLTLTDTYNVKQNQFERLNSQITELLKKSILQEAIQGQLVPQIKAEGAAEELLAEIAEEKKRLVKEGKLKKSALTASRIFHGDDNKYYEQIGSDIEEIEVGFNFPDSWSVCRLRDLCQLTDGEKSEGSYPCLDAKYLRGKSSATLLTNGKFVRKGDNIILVDGENSGEVFIVPCDGYMGSTFKQLWISEHVDKDLVLLIILFYKSMLRNSKKGAAIPHLNKELFYNIVVGLPPLKEQQRIVRESNRLFDTLK